MNPAKNPQPYNIFPFPTTFGNKDRCTTVIQKRPRIKIEVAKAINWIELPGAST